MSTQELEAVLADPRVWRGQRIAAGAGPRRGLPSGIAALDAALPDGGLPAAALTEVYAPVVGLGELSLFLPALATRGWLALIAAPHIPYAPALVAAGIDLASVLIVRSSSARETCWAMEQTLRAGTCGAVVAWLDAPPRAQSTAARPAAHRQEASGSFALLRRLQLAAEAGGSCALLFRPWAARSAASPAALRLVLAPGRSGLRITLLKRRGLAGRAVLEIARR